MILVIGASGAVGVPTITHLVKRGATVRALTSKPDSAEKLQRLGVRDTVLGDFREPTDLRRAIAGADAVIQIPPRFTEDEAAIGMKAIAAAREAGISHYVFVSAFHPQMRQMDHHWSKLVVEEAVIESGLSFTILQPAMFMQNLRVEWPAIQAQGIYGRPYSAERKLALVDTEDLGEAAAIVLTEPGFRGAIFELASGESLSHAEMAAILAEEWGKPVRAVARDLGEWERWAREHGWKPWSIAAYLKMCRHYDAHGYPGGNALVLSTILGREPGGFRAFVRRFLAAEPAPAS
jgi:uncharacterized protein YbjT (DUF2867 family)